MYRPEIDHEQARVLVVEDDEGANRVLTTELRLAGYPVESAHDGDAAREKLRSFSPHLVLLDLTLPPERSCQVGLGLFDVILTELPSTKVVIVTGTANRDIAMECHARGAIAYLDKPLDIRRILPTVEHALLYRSMDVELQKMQKAASGKVQLGDLIGVSGFMQDLYEEISNIADSPENVLITGETGTGKNVVALTIHRQGKRAQSPYHELNCSTIPGSLFESELFGYKKGAFSGANTSQTGLFQAAHKGSLFLDEFAEIPVEHQAKLLDAVQTKSVRPVGSDKKESVDVRIISATNRDPHKAIQGGKLREDLYYRLSTIHVHLAPLRERKEDVRFLANHFFNLYNGNRCKALQKDCNDVLTAYTWPGNVRQLENVMKAVILKAKPGSTITSDMLEKHLRQKEPLWKGSAAAPQETLKKRLDQYQLDQIQSAVKQFGSVSKAAQVLGITRQGLYKKMKKLKHSDGDDD